jgi:hypothetical protein
MTGTLTNVVSILMVCSESCFRVCAAPAATHIGQQSKALKIVALSF